MSSTEVLGQFLWHELLTGDPEAGAKFYSKVLGWNARLREGDAAYTMLANAQGPVGGTRAVGSDPLAGRVGRCWLTYVGVPDVTAAIAAVEGHGGRVVHPVTALPAGGGRYAVIADPEGGVIGLYEPAVSPSGGGAHPMAGPVVWHELTADNAEAALRFYQAVFGWEVLSTMPMGGDVGNYYLFGLGGTQMGGAFNRPKHLPPNWPRWLVYLAVPGVTAAVEAAKAAGGKLLNGPNQVPGGNWIAQVVDSQGVPVALHGPKDTAVAAKPKVKAAVRTKSKTKSKVKVKAKSAPKSKVTVRRKSKAGNMSKSKRPVKPKGKTKPKSKSKSKTRAPVRSKARKAPRRPK